LSNQKTCIACQQPKEATKEFFVADARNKDGLQGRCRECDNQRRKKVKIVAPKREAFADAAAFQAAMDWHHLELDKAAAERVLADPETKFTKRNAARESLEKTLAAMKKAPPSVVKSVAAPAVAATPDTAPMKSQHAIGSAEWIQGFREQQDRPWSAPSFDLLTWMNGEYQWRQEDPTSYAAEVKRREDAENERRRSSAETTSGDVPYVRTVADKAAIAIAEAKSAAPFVPPPQRELILVLEDGFHFYAEDLQPAIPPFPVGAKFARAPLPPDYSLGDRHITPGWVYDRNYYCWFRR
jgi:hypothetical protein